MKGVIGGATFSYFTDEVSIDEWFTHNLKMTCPLKLNVLEFLSILPHSSLWEFLIIFK